MSGSKNGLVLRQKQQQQHCPLDAPCGGIWVCTSICSDNVSSGVRSNNRRDAARARPKPLPAEQTRVGVGEYVEEVSDREVHLNAIAHGNENGSKVRPI